jgi:putative polyhydroxyalkanoate system protein
MSAIVIQRNHSMETEELRDAVERLLEEFSSDHPGLIKGVEWESSGKRAKAKGKGFNATFEMGSSTVVVRIELSLLARAFKGKVESGLTRKMDEILGSA